MAVIKNTPRYLKIDDDNKIIQPSEMPDALNIRVTEDIDGNSGVIKNIPSNAAATLNLGYGLGTNKVVGTYEHEGTNRLFIFVHNSLGIHTVYEMNQGDSGFTKIIESSNILLSGEHLHLDGMVIDDDLHIYFTDGVNEPQKINVDSGHTLGTYPSSQNEARVMKAAPWAPTVSISTDSAKKTNELYGKAFQFALQWVYRDGEVSAIGEYSSPVTGINTLDNLSDSLNYSSKDNKITLGIPFGTLGLGLGTTIPFTKVFYKNPEDNTMYYIGEYTTTELFNGIDFYNDKLYSAVADSEYNKTTDNVPKSAKAQTIAANRIFYANYKEGFDKATVSASLTANYEALALNTELPITVIRNGVAESDIGLEIDTLFVDTFIDGNPIPTTVDFRFSTLTVNEITGRAITFYLSDGTTVKKTFTAAEHNGNTRLEMDGNFTKSASISAATYADYNTNLAAALDGDTFTFDISSGRASWDNGNAALTYNDWSAAFDSGTVSFQVSATATANGVDVSIVPTTFSVSGTRAWLSDPILTSVYKDYVTSLSGTFGALATDRYMDTRISENFSSVSEGSGDNRTFKSGESHSIGVVFEDTSGRTSGVYELGSVDIERKSERVNKGKASIDVILSASNLDPDFQNYFYVYNGGNSISDFVQYSVPSAFTLDGTKSDGAVSNTIYVSLRALQGAKNSYCDNNDIEYTYSEGDKLRIISYIDNEIREYPSDFEFEVKGVETIETDAFILNGASYDEKIHNGQFLVLQENSEALGFAYTQVFGGTSDWGNDVMVEIYTPSKETEVKIYYAIEGKYSVADIGNTQNLTEGNAWYKRRAMKFALSAASEDFTQEVFSIESNQYFDKDNSTKGKLGGKPYAVLTDEKEYQRLSSLTYSEPQASDAPKVFLSSFNASLANFSDYEMNYGGIYGLVDSSDSIMLLQSDKVSRVPVSRQILSTATGTSFVTQSTDVLGLQQHYQGNFGINEDRSAFLKADGDVYLVDVARSKLIAITPQGVSEISEEGVSSWVEGRCNSMLEDPQGYFISIGNDKDNKEVIFSLQNKPISNTKSIIFSKKLGKFTSFVSYTGSYYGNLGNRFFQIRDNNAYEAEKGTTYGNFFGTQSDASFTTVFNSSPSTTKVFQALSMESNRPADITIETAKNSATINKNTFSEREDAWYGYIPRSEGSSEYMILGVVAAEDDPKITFSSRVSRIPFRLGGDAYGYVNGVYTQIGGATVNGVLDSNSLSFTNAGAISVGDVIAIKSDSSIDGDAVRGHYAKVQYVLDDSSKFEVFAVNASVAQSSLNNNGGSQQ